MITSKSCKSLGLKRAKYATSLNLLTLIVSCSFKWLICLCESAYVTLLILQKKKKNLSEDGLFHQMNETRKLIILSPKSYRGSIWWRYDNVTISDIMGINSRARPCDTDP